MWTRWRRSAAEQKIRIKRGVAEGGGEGEGLKEAARCVSLALDWQLCFGGRRPICTRPKVGVRKEENLGETGNQKSSKTNKQTNKDAGEPPSSQRPGQKTLERRGAAGPSGCSGADTATLPTNASRHATERIKELGLVFDSVAERPSGFK